MQQLVMQLPSSTISLSELESLELNGVSEFDAVRLLSVVELPHLCRMLLTHITSSRSSPFNDPVQALPSLRQLRLHTTEMSHENLLNVLAQSQNLELYVANVSLSPSEKHSDCHTHYHLTEQHIFRRLVSHA